MDYLRNNNELGKLGWAALICATLLVMAFIPYLLILVSDLSEQEEAALDERVVYAQGEPTLHFDVFQDAQTRMMGDDDNRLMVFIPSTGVSYILSGSASHYTNRPVFLVRKNISGEYSLPAHHNIVCFAQTKRRCFLGKSVK
jgi:hypothetical protein